MKFLKYLFFLVVAVLKAQHARPRLVPNTPEEYSSYVTEYQA